MLRRFLRKNELAVRVIENNNHQVIDADQPAEDPFLGFQVAAEYAAIAKDFVTHAAVTIGVTYAACQIVKRLCR